MRFPFHCIANNRGISLLEAIIATVLLVLSVLTIGLVLPRSSRVAVANRAHAQGSELANTLMQNIAGQPCTTLPATAISDVKDPGNFQGNNCECSLEQGSNLPLATPPQVAVGGIIYTQRLCINYESAPGGQTQSQCPPAVPSPCLANVVVNVSWSVGVDSASTNATTMVYSN